MTRRLQTRLAISEGIVSWIADSKGRGPLSR
jgi:hypothetical protein